MTQSQKTCEQCSHSAYLPHSEGLPICTRQDPEWEIFNKAFKLNKLRLNKQYPALRFYQNDLAEECPHFDLSFFESEILEDAH